MTDAVSPVVRVGMAIVAGTAKGPATTGEDDVHASGLEEVLIGQSADGLVKPFGRNLRGSMHRCIEQLVFVGPCRLVHPGKLNIGG